METVTFLGMNDDGLARLLAHIPERNFITISINARTNKVDVVLSASIIKLRCDDKSLAMIIDDKCVTIPNSTYETLGIR